MSVRHARASSLRELTSTTVGVRFSDYTVLEDKAIYSVVITLVCIILEKGDGFQSGMELVTRNHALEIQQSLMAFILLVVGIGVVVKCSKYLQRERLMELQSLTKTLLLSSIRVVTSL